MVSLQFLGNFLKITMGGNVYYLPRLTARFNTADDKFEVFTADYRMRLHLGAFSDMQYLDGADWMSFMDFADAETYFAQGIGILPASDYVAVKDENGDLISASNPFPVTMSLPIDGNGFFPTSENMYLFSWKNEFEWRRSIFWTQYITTGGSGIFSKNESAYILTSANTGVAATFTKRRFNGGKSGRLLVKNTFQCNRDTGAEYFVGFFDLDNYDSPVIDGTIRNGVCLVINDITMSIRIYNQGVIVKAIPQREWDDELNGTGASGLAIDFKKIVQIGIMMDSISVLGIEFFIYKAGKSYKFHCIDWEELNLSTPFVRTTALPPAFLIDSVGAAGELKIYETSVQSIGRFMDVGLPFTVASVAGSQILSGQTEVLLGIRLKSDSYNAEVLVEAFSVIVTSSGNAEFWLSLNPTYNGTVTWTDVPNTDLQKAENNNNIWTADTLKFAGAFISGRLDAAGFSEFSDLFLGKAASGRMDEIWVVCKSLSSNEVYQVSINGISK